MARKCGVLERAEDSLQFQLVALQVNDFFAIAQSLLVMHIQLETHKRLLLQVANMPIVNGLLLNILL